MKILLLICFLILTGCAKKPEPEPAHAINIPTLTNEEWNTIGTNLNLWSTGSSDNWTPLAELVVSTNELFRLSTNGTAVVTIKWNGEVIYDTNNVSEATKLFWKTLSELIQRQK